MTTTQAEEIGRNAFINDEPAVPAFNSEIMSAIKSLPVGGGSAALMKAFLKGWHAANLVAR